METPSSLRTRSGQAASATAGRCRVWSGMRTSAGEFGRRRGSLPRGPRRALSLPRTRGQHDASTA
eukprot:5997106-Heterocapsa_arctica.AAC.1